MSWNEPGNSDKNNPWKKSNQSDGPPDIGEALDKFLKKINGLLGGKGGKKSNGIGSGGTQSSSAGFSLIAIVALVVWALSGIYIVGPAEQAAVTTFGKYSKTVGPGPHWIARFIQSQSTVNVESISTYPFRAQMLTKDENIVAVEIAAQYRVGNLEKYLFNIVEPDITLQEAAASALRQVVGQMGLQAIITTGRGEIRNNVMALLQELMERYETGLIVADVSVQPARYPDEVREAFDDAIRAREDAERSINQASAYAGEIVPIAQGQAKRLIEEAEAYRSQVVLAAEGNVVRFNLLLPEYVRAPEVTRERLYIGTIAEVLSNTRKILVDSGEGNNNLFYLPLDRMLAQDSQQQTDTAIPFMPSSINTTENISSGIRSLPNRGGRAS